MSQTKISQLELLEESSPDDLLIAVDVSDTSMAPTGTDKKLHVPAKYSINVMDDPDVRAAVANETDASAAIQAIIDANWGREIYFPCNTYYLETRITVYGEGTSLVGETSGYTSDTGSPYAGQTTILKMITPGEPVVIIPSQNPGVRAASNGSSVRHLRIEGCESWTQYLRRQCVLPTGIIYGVTGYLNVNGSEQDGIRIECGQIRIDDVMINNCGRDGVRWVTDGAFKLSDFNYVSDVRVFNCRGSAFHMEPGGDSNANSVIGCNANINLLWGFNDQSFLGNFYTSPMSAENYVLTGPATSDDDTSHPANQVLVGAVHIPAGDISWTRTGDTVTLTITDWAYLMNGAYPLQPGHGVVITGTSQIDGTHLLVTVSQGASTTTVTFTAPGSNVLTPQTTGLIRAAEPTETMTKAVALLRADSKLTATEVLGGDFHRSNVTGSTVVTGLYGESNRPIQVSSATILVGPLVGTGVDWTFGHPMVLWGNRGDTHIDGPTTNCWSEKHEDDTTIQTFRTYGVTANQTKFIYRTSVVSPYPYIYRIDDAPTYYYMWYKNPGVDVTAKLLYGFTYGGRSYFNSAGTEAVEININWSGNVGGEPGSGGLKIGDGTGATKHWLKGDGTFILNGSTVSVGAADSGGSGYRLLRIPN